MLTYRFLLTLIAPVVLAALLLRVLRGRETWADLGERFGRGVPTAGAPLWLHGASNGELTAAKPLIEALLAASPNLTLAVTCNTVTAREMATSWTLPRISVRLAPLDFRLCLGGVFGRVRPQALIVIENELWPNRLALCHARGLPVALVGARLSARSARRWRFARGLARRLLGPIAFAAPQDAASGARLVALGLPEMALAPAVSLKSAVSLPPPDPKQLAELAPGFERAETVLAASTHAGEEPQVLAAFKQARAARPGLRLILAPRHPVRGGEVAEAIRSAGLDFARRSDGASPGAAPVYLADTLGEMPLWYTLAGLCFVGGSLVEKGGHTPYEPAQFGCAILHGPHVENAATAYAALAAAQAAVEVGNAETLAAALVRLDGPAQAALTDAARVALGGEPPDALAETLLNRLTAQTGPAEAVS